MRGGDPNRKIVSASSADAAAVNVSALSEQAAMVQQPKQDEKTESTTDGSVDNNNPSVPSDKRKRVPSNNITNNHRRFPRLFRPASPSKKQSPPKKIRMERRRSTGSSADANHSSDEVAPIPQTVSRTIPFLRRNVSLGNEPTVDLVAEQNKMARRRSLFRRGRQQRQHTKSPPPLETRQQDFTEEHAPWYEQTRVITVQNSPGEEEKKEENDIIDTEHEDTPRNSLCSSTEIFQHSYLETLCGIHAHDVDDLTGQEKSNQRRLPDDPTIQESIECVFSTSLEEDISRMLHLEDSDEDEDMPGHSPVAPSQIQQSVMRTRSDISRTTPPQSRARKRVESVKLAHVGSFKSSGAQDIRTVSSEPPLSVSTPSAGAPIFSTCCTCKRGKKPQMDPSAWPQAPLLLRPTPGSGTRVKRIRLVKDDEDKAILWQAGQTSKLTWPQELKKCWGKNEVEQSIDKCEMCPECMILPINNGNEEVGETLVTDFETDLFEGTLMLRLRYSNGTTKLPYQDDRGYFTGMNRRYQAVIRGRFKKELPWTECKTGFVLDRPAGKLPAKWILKGAVKVLSFFAPHLEVKFDGPRPMSMTPLGSTPQVLAVHNPEEPYSIEGMQEEPSRKEHTLLGEASSATNTLQRARARKKAFDKLYAHGSKEPKTDTSKVYTFEFLQHLFNFQDFSVELGSMLGPVPLAPIVDGQALPIMATHADFDRRLWSFDVWHESLVTGNA
uniref:Domain of unknown function at the cortex 1 domain-containing protein n=1 Tax=Amphora coffeiformis TaxID=265554 RepID=A0A7S3L713_9STRA|mmetsp:Transcript_5119/g.9792  ORF Transcript_5119/g.9792 Transcript_5119/m.9792 type:complete len:724 (+) Transcript_5119:107-2278(+)|eukprot:scaffold36436_cov176-Amphora_coffeaeformis.AAC.6